MSSSEFDPISSIENFLDNAYNQPKNYRWRRVEEDGYPELNSIVLLYYPSLNDGVFVDEVDGEMYLELAIYRGEGVWETASGMFNKVVELWTYVELPEVTEEEKGKELSHE